MSVFSLFFKRNKYAPGSSGNIYGNKGADAITEANEKYFGDSGDTMHHSRYYHRYYEGYTEVRTERPGGKYINYKIERVYTAPYTVVDMERREYVGWRVVYGALAVLAILLYISAFLDRRVAMNMTRLSPLTIMLTLIPLFVLAMSLIGYLTRPKLMKYYDYRTSTGRVKLWSAVSSAGCMLTVLIFAVYLIFAGSVNAGAEVLYAIRLIAAAACCLVLFLMERNVKYIEVPNKVKLPPGEYHRIQ